MKKINRKISKWDILYWMLAFVPFLISLLFYNRDVYKRQLPMEHVQISAEIISYAKEVLNRPINPNVYITLTDHINFALERYKQKMMYSNPLIREVRSFYHAEYLIGEYAIAMIERGLGVKLPVDEAASIALHIVNAEYDAPMGDTIKITNLIQQVLALPLLMRRHLKKPEKKNENEQKSSGG